jgi:hypothetical protein
MAIQLANILAYSNVASGATASLPHGLNFGPTRPVIPDTIDVPTGFEFVSADDTNVVVQNTGAAVASVNVLVEAYHTYLRAFGPAAVKNLTPQPYVRGASAGALGAGYSTFVYQPGGTQGGNVFTVWNDLMTALGSVQGLRVLEFDDTIVSPAVIPGNSFVDYDMTDVIWKGHNNSPGTSVDLAVNATFTGLRNFFGNLTVRNLNTVVSPVADFAAFDLVNFDGGNCECAAGAVPFFDLTTAGAGFVVFQYTNGGGIGLNPVGGVPVVDLAVAGLTLFNNIEHGGPQRNSIEGPVGSVSFHQVTAIGGVLGPQPAFLGTTSIFVTHPSPQRNVVPGPGSTPYTSADTVDVGDVALGDTSGGAFALTLDTLPGASFNAQGILTIVKETSGSAGLTVAPGGANTIDGGAGALAVPAGGAVGLIPDGVSNWIQVF